MNLGQLRTALQQRGYATDTATAQTELINSAYRRIVGMRRWPFLEVVNSPYTIQTFGDSYPLSTVTNLLHLEAVRIEDPDSSTSRPLLTYLDPQEWRNIQHYNPESGTPRYWTTMDGYLWLWPTPDKDYTVDLDYVKKVSDLSSDSDTPLIPSTYHDVLVWGAIAELCFRERDMAGYDIANERYNRILADMEAEYALRQRQTTSRVGRSGFHDQFETEYNPWLNY